MLEHFPRAFRLPRRKSEFHCIIIVISSRQFIQKFSKAVKKIPYIHAPLLNSQILFLMRVEAGLKYRNLVMNKIKIFSSSYIRIFVEKPRKL
jgi:hypothetical protein